MVSGHSSALKLCYLKTSLDSHLVTVMTVIIYQAHTTYQAKTQLKHNFLLNADPDFCKDTVYVCFPLSTIQYLHGAYALLST